MEEKTVNIEGKKPSLKKETNQFVKSGKIFAYCIVIPALIHFLIFYVYINFSTLILAFSYKTKEGAEIFSFVNFEKFFTSVYNELTQPIPGQYGLVDALLNTFKYFFLNVLKSFLAALIAYFFFKKVYLHKVYKVIFFLPSMIPGLVYIMIFKNFVATYGPLYNLLALFGYKMPDLLSNPATATPTILFYVLWSGFGAQMLIFVGVMNRIPQSVIEAATLDGCNSSKEFFHIIVPLIWETFATYLLIGISCIFMASGPILYFTGGEPFTNTITLSFWIFLGVRDGSYNYPAAIGLIFTVLALPLMFLSRWLMGKIETITY